MKYERTAYLLASNRFFPLVLYTQVLWVRVHSEVWIHFEQWFTEWYYCVLICQNRRNQLIRVAWIGQSHWTKYMFIYIYIYIEIVRVNDAHKAIDFFLCVLGFHFFSFICRFLSLCSFCNSHNPHNSLYITCFG